MPRHRNSDAHEWINEIPTVPVYYLAKPQPRELTLLFFFNDTATTEIYTLSLHDALPICQLAGLFSGIRPQRDQQHDDAARSEEHTSELQSPKEPVCRLLLEKKNYLV